MRKKVAVVAVLIVVIVGIIWALWPRESKLQPVSRAEGLRLLSQVRKGIVKSRAAMKNGCGKMTMQSQVTIPKRVDFKEKATCDVTFARDNYKVRVLDRYHQNREPGKSITERLQQLGKQIVNPRSAKASSGPGPMSLSGINITRNSIYSGNKKNVIEYTPKKKYAQIFDTSSIQGYAVDRIMRSITMSRSGPYSEFKAGVVKSAPAKGYTTTRSEPVVLGHQRIGRDDCIVIEQTFTYRYPHLPPGMDISQRLNFWICPAKGFCILRSEAWGHYPGSKQIGDMLMSVTNNDVKEYKPGVWGMVRSNTTSYGVTEKEEPYKQGHYSISYDPGFRLNVSRSKLDLKLKLPKGTRVDDELKHKTYVVK